MNSDHKELVEFIGEHFEHIGQKFEHIDHKFDELAGKIAQLPTKAYLDDKIADLEGGLVTKLRKEDEKVNRLAEILKAKNVLTATDIEELKKLQVFPR